jgi:sulfide:quinone oxidoreductase
MACLGGRRTLRHLTAQGPVKPRVVIAGGGIAGLEAALALADLAADRAELVVVAPDPDFVYKPLTVEEPFTQQPAQRRELEPALGRIGVGLVRGAVSGVDPDSRTLELGQRSRFAYDLLVVCIGGRARPAYEGVQTFWSRGDMRIDELIQRAHATLGRSLTLLVPPATSWSLPLYELALLIRRRAEELGLSDLRLRLVTPENAPLILFGRRASDAVASLLAARRISVDANRLVTQDTTGVLHVPPMGVPIEPNVALALPVIEGPWVAGLPPDPHGFIPVDLHGRVEGLKDVYAAGDGTTVPIKQGGLATQQADAAAEHIAARLGAEVEPKPFDPVLRGQLLTGMEPLHMKHRLAGGNCEGTASLDYLWWPPQKVAGRYLSAWLGQPVLTDLELPLRPLDVEISWPRGWHAEPVSDAEVSVEP